jgi:hypothetical protein
MQAKIIPFFMERNMKLQAKLLRQHAQECKFNPSLVVRYRLLKTVNRLLWDVNLFITSIFVTRTPFTTFTCLVRNYLGRGHVSHLTFNGAQGRITRTMGKTVQSLKRNFWFFIHEKG